MNVNPVGITTLIALLMIISFAVAAKKMIVGKRPLILSGPATDQLFDEPPAIAEFLVNGFRPGIPAVTATLVDLAARGMLRIEPGAIDYVTVRVVASPAALLPYEQLVYDTVVAHARDGRASGRDLRRAFLKYDCWSRFSRLVIDDAIGHGLATPRSSRVTLRSTRFDLQARQIPTEAGIKAAARWFGVQKHLEGDEAWKARDASMVEEFGRRLAYATALGRTPWIWLHLVAGASRDATHAWSDHGRQWRQVKILRPRFTHLTKPAKALAVYLPLSVAALALTVAIFPAGVGHGGLLLALSLIVAAVTVRLLVATGRIVADILRPRYVHGVIIRTEPLPPDAPAGARNGRPRRWRRLGDTSWIVIDRGRRSWIRGIRFDPARAPELRPGDHVRAHVAPWTCWAHEVVPVRPASHARGSAPGL
jgi:hypothetical protein